MSTFTHQHQPTNGRLVYASVILVALLEQVAWVPHVNSAEPFSTAPISTAPISTAPFSTTSVDEVFEMTSSNQTWDIQTCADDHPWGLGTLEFFAGLEGSKQPQDYGVNANLGGRAHVNWGRLILPEHGLGIQLGTALNATGNAVRVYELLGETTGRTQSFSTAGIFQRTPSGISWGFAYDFLYQESFDQFFLGQWRGRIGYQLNCCNEFGVTAQLSGERDSGLFNATLVTLDPITQGSVYWRHRWESGTETTLWAGLAEAHGESNPITGFSPPKDEVFLFGADILAPLNDNLALYGETNLMMPTDTGAVDAYLGIQWHPWGGAKQSRRMASSPVLPVAGSTSFSVDLVQ